MSCLVIICIAAVISFIIVSAMKKKMNTAVKQDSANSYIKDGSFNVTAANEFFMYSRTVSHKIESNSSSSGGGTHTSSSGRSHGGGGGKF